jgi:hypothetical protein
MTPRTPRVCAAIALAACGCSYDWSVPASPLDAGNPVDATTPFDSAPPDAVDGSNDAPTTTADAGPDADADAAADCDSLIAKAQAAYVAARTCTTLESACTTTLDQCGCEKPVADDSSTATSDYEMDVTAIKQAGCASSCGQCSVPPATVCLDMATGDGGFTMSCQ